MAVSADHLARLDAALGAPDAGDAAIAALRKDLAGLSLTRCDLGDVDQETPFRQYGRHTVFLVDASDHCWVFTTDPAQATGLVVATNRG